MVYHVADLGGKCLFEGAEFSDGEVVPLAEGFKGGFAIFFCEETVYREIAPGWVEGGETVHFGAGEKRRSCRVAHFGELSFPAFDAGEEVGGCGETEDVGVGSGVLAEGTDQVGVVFHESGTYALPVIAGEDGGEEKVVEGVSAGEYVGAEGEEYLCGIGGLGCVMIAFESPALH